MKNGYIGKSDLFNLCPPECRLEKIYSFTEIIVILITITTIIIIIIVMIMIRVVNIVRFQPALPKMRQELFYPSWGLPQGVRSPINEDEYDDDGDDDDRDDVDDDR